MSTPHPVDRWYPPLGPCLICGVPGADQRHRVIEAIADAVLADPGSDEEVAASVRLVACLRGRSTSGRRREASPFAA